MTDINDDSIVAKDAAASIASTFSWNTILSRTNISSLTCAIFSDQEAHFFHSFDDVIRAVATLGLRRYRYEEIAREEKVGEGETYLVERCVVANQVLAIKHLKTNSELDDQTSHRRLRAVIMELQVMRHRPLRNHPNFPSVFGYGWNMNSTPVMPYILVEYAPKGTLRQYLKSMPSSLPREHLQILAGDVASALSALHTCGIVHGDVKLDNVLVIHSWDRPSQALAKLSDFGHALVVNDKSSKHTGTMRYGGTFIYNAPEVHDQHTFPIDRADMPLCDIWAFGLLIWELFLQGEDHLSYCKRIWPEVEAQMEGQRLIPANARRYAMASVPGKLEYMLIRATFHRTLQTDPTMRTAHLEDLPLLTEWNDSSISGLESELALHLESPSLTYEMFRPENGREIPWKHEEQIYQMLKRTNSTKRTKDNSSVSWQLALCHYVGFGIPRDAASAWQYAKIAKENGHPAAEAFASLLDLNFAEPSESYVTKISRLLRSAVPHCLPPMMQACFDGDSKALESLLLAQENPNSSTIDGCTVFHWFFMLEDPVAMAEQMKSMFAESIPLYADLPFSSLRKAHEQWPLQLLGTPLGVAISVNSLPTVKALVALGAGPLSYIYRGDEFPIGDQRLGWTALHMAAKYHCSEILDYLLSLVSESSLSVICPLSCALPFSTSLERLAMHGTQRQMELDKTVAAIRKIQSLRMALLSGLTALTQAIDFQDYDVVAALLRAEPELASCQLTSVEDPTLFNCPIHLAAQLAARRDVPEALSILQLINDYTNDFDAETEPSRDHLGMTALHLAVTGPSSRATRWILERRIGLLVVMDNLGRTALHCCASEANLELLLAKGSAIIHTDMYGMSVLHRACHRGELELVRCLLKYSPPLDLRNDLYGTPLHCAIIKGSIDVVLALLEAGASVNAQDHEGNTPVHIALRMGRLVILRNLLQRGGSRSIRNFNNRNPGNLGSMTRAPHSIAALRILQGLQTLDAATSSYSFLEAGDNTSTNFEFLPHITDLDHALPPDYSWGANDVAHQALAETNESNLDEASTIGYEELPAFLDGRMGKKKLLEMLTNDISHDMHDTNGYLDSQETTRLQAEIVPYVDDSIWQDNEPSVVSIDKMMAQTAFGIREILKIHVGKQGLKYNIFKPKVAMSEQGPSRIYRNLEFFMKFAVDQALKIVEQTKPSWAMPGRRRRHLETIIACEVTRIEVAGDTNIIHVPDNSSLHLAHPLLKDSSASKDRKRWQTKLQQSMWRSEREANRIWSDVATLAANNINAGLLSPESLWTRIADPPDYNNTIHLSQFTPVQWDNIKRRLKAITDASDDAPENALAGAVSSASCDVLDSTLVAGEITQSPVELSQGNFPWQES